MEYKNSFRTDYLAYMLWCHLNNLKHYKSVNLIYYVENIYKKSDVGLIRKE